MSNDRSNKVDRPVGELWVELSRDEKKCICDALIDWNKPDVMQEFATLVRFTRDYLRQQTNGSMSSSNKKGKDEEVLVDKPNNPPRKTRKRPLRTCEVQMLLRPRESDSDDAVIKEESDF